jgi:hypothetical protein
MTAVENVESATAAGRLPLWVKVVFSAYMAVLVPVYWHYYGPTNFLYFCDVAMILTLIAVWTENALLVSMCAVGILAPQALWVLDFLLNLAGISFTGLTDYMFAADHSLFLRLLSLFHGWLPFLLLYLVWKLGYDQRAFVAWTVLAWLLVLICFFFMPPPNPDPGLTPVNINYVWGMSDTAAQTWMPAWLWMLALIVGMPALLFAPVHFLLMRLMPQARPPQG